MNTKDETADIFLGKTNPNSLPIGVSSGLYFGESSAKLQTGILWDKEDIIFYIDISE